MAYQPSPAPQPPQNIEHRKNQQAYHIALIVIIPFIGYFGASLFILGVDVTKEMTALLGGYVATVLVYFFGQKQAQVLTNQVQETEKEKNLLEIKANELHNEMIKVETLRNKLEKQYSDLSNNQLDDLNNRKSDIEKFYSMVQPYIEKHDIKKGG